MGFSSMGGKIPKEFFGMHVNNGTLQSQNPYNTVECPLFTDLGYGLIRLWDGYVVHRLLNPSNGVYNWAALDYRMSKIREAGLSVIYTFGAMPDWATTANGPYPNYNPNPPLQQSYLSDFVTALCTRYKGQIKYYETWNEVDSTGSWVGTLPQMVTNAQTIYTAVKAADPDAIVLSPNCINFGALNTNTGMFYTDSFLSQASAYCDGIALHPYTDPSQPENYITLGKAYQNLAAKYGKTKLITTETGVLSYYSSTGSLKKPLTNGAGDKMDENQAASWVTRMYLCSWLGGINAMCYYLLDNVNNVMAIDMVNYSPSGATASIKYKPARAIQYLTSTLVGGNLWGYKQSGYLHECNFSSGSGRGGTVMWMSDYKTSTVDLTGYSEVRDCEGLSITPVSNYTLTNVPLFCFK